MTLILEQTTLELHRPGATVVPIIISSDKTQLMLFHGKAAYPVYLTIGNIPKDIRRKPSRRAQILITYIPTTKLEGITNRTSRRRAIANLYHSCMQVLLAPITAYGETGIKMVGGDGILLRSVDRSVRLGRLGVCPECQMAEVGKSWTITESV
jgi:hypothetical protein